MITMLSRCALLVAFAVVRPVVLRRERSAQRHLVNKKVIVINKYS
jgi:hypothetical protein